MDNTQLPAEVLEAIELKAEHEAALQFHPVYSLDQNTACRICYRNGAKEYATKLHQANKEKLNLKMTIKGIEDQLTVERVQCAAARALLTEVLVMNEMWGDLPGEFVNKVKTFLDGNTHSL